MDNKLQKTGPRAGTLPVIVAVLAVLCALLPYIAAQRYALFYTDDFSFMTYMDSAHGSSRLLKAMEETAFHWRSWQGTYSSTFLLMLLNPLNTYSYGLLRLILIALSAGTVAAALLSAVLLCEYLGVSKKIGPLLWALTTLPILLYREYTEIYLWYTGAMAYLAPVLFLLLAFVFLLMGKKGKKLWYAFAAAAAFMMAGGVLECVGFGMFMLLLLCVIVLLREGRIEKGFCAVFLVGLAGALLNALAPGNFARYGGQDAAETVASSIFSSLLNSGRAVFQELGWIFGSTGFVTFLILAFLLGITVKRTMDRRCLAAALAGFALAPAVTVFPVVLGYSWAGGGLPGRCLFLLDASLYLSMIMIALLLGCRLSAVRLPKFGKAVCAVAAVALAFSPLLCGFAPRAYPPAEITENLINGSIEEFSTSWRAVFDYLHECGGGDVNAEAPTLQRTAGCPNVFISTSPEHWDNRSIAQYFGLDSVWVYSTDLE